MSRQTLINQATENYNKEIQKINDLPDWAFNLAGFAGDTYHQDIKDLDDLKKSLRNLSKLSGLKYELTSYFYSCGCLCVVYSIDNIKIIYSCRDVEETDKILTSISNGKCVSEEITIKTVRCNL